MHIKEPQDLSSGIAQEAKVQIGKPQDFKGGDPEGKEPHITHEQG